MRQKTFFKNQSQYHLELYEVFTGLLDDYSKIETLLTENFYTTEKDNYHFISQLLKPTNKNRAQISAKSLIYRDAYKTELLSAGASEFVFLFSSIFGLKLLDYKNNNNNQNSLKDLEAAVDKLKFFIESNSKPATEKDIKKQIEVICQNKTVSEVCYETIKTAGLEGKIFVENNNKQDKFIIELKSGYSFPLKSFPFFLTSGNWDHREVKMLVVDGFVESVSEIEHILIANHDRKEPMCIVSQGFSEEVVSTLYVNFQKGKTNIIPLRLSADISNLNVVNDIGVACGMDPITSLKGQLITFVKYETCPIVERVRVTEKNTTVECSRTRSAVSSQIKAILLKRNDNAALEDVQDILDRRIKSLTPNTTVLYLPHMDTFKNESMRVKLDICFRQTKTLVNYGIIHKNKIKNYEHQYANDIEKIIFKSFLDTMTLSKNNIASSISVFSAILAASKTVLMLCDSKGFVGIEQ
jgi:hypothetical protein